MNVVRLVKRAKKGNKDALLQLITAEQDAYYRLALTYMGNDHDAMDAVEDMIVTLYEKMDQLQNAQAFYSWSKTILVNSCKGLLRQRSKLVLVDEWETGANRLHPGQEAGRDKVKGSPLPIHPAAADDSYLRSEQQIDIQSLFQHINEQQREAIQLKYFHDLDYQSIADITQVSIGTVKSRIHQGLKKLKEHYGGDRNE